MMRFELRLEKPEPSRAWKSALTIALAYIVGGIIPLSAYLFLSNAQSALRLSVVVTLAALAVFGSVRSLPAAALLAVWACASGLEPCHAKTLRWPLYWRAR